MSEKHPCQKDCPERSATCRLSCPKFKTHFAKQQARYAEKQKAIEKKLDIESYVQQEIIKNTRNSRKKKRR